MKLYHATPIENLDKIKADGVLTGCDGVYFSPDLDVAKQYGFNNAEEIAVFVVDLDESELCADAEFAGNGDDFLQESLDNGSCLVKRDVDISSSEILFFGEDD